MKSIIAEMNLTELSFAEATELYGGGGESLWYWVGYGIGAATYWVVTHPAEIRHFITPV